MLTLLRVRNSALRARRESGEASLISVIGGVVIIGIVSLLLFQAFRSDARVRISYSAANAARHVTSDAMSQVQNMPLADLDTAYSTLAACQGRGSGASLKSPLTDGDVIIVDLYRTTSDPGKTCGSQQAMPVPGTTGKYYDPSYNVPSLVNALDSTSTEEGKNGIVPSSFKLGLATSYTTATDTNDPKVQLTLNLSYRTITDPNPTPVTLRSVRSYTADANAAYVPSGTAIPQVCQESVQSASCIPQLDAEGSAAAAGASNTRIKLTWTTPNPVPSSNSWQLCTGATENSLTACSTTLTAAPVPGKTNTVTADVRASQLNSAKYVAVRLTASSPLSTLVELERP